MMEPDFSKGFTIVFDSQKARDLRAELLQRPILERLQECLYRIARMHSEHRPLQTGPLETADDFALCSAIEDAMSRIKELEGTNG